MVEHLAVSLICGYVIVCSPVGRTILQKSSHFVQCVHLTQDRMLCIDTTSSYSAVCHILLLLVWVVCWKGGSLKLPSTDGISIRRTHPIFFSTGLDVRVCGNDVVGCPLIQTWRLMLDFVIACASACCLTPPPYGMGGQELCQQSICRTPAAPGSTRETPKLKTPRQSKVCSKIWSCTSRLDCLLSIVGVVGVIGGRAIDHNTWTCFNAMRSFDTIS